MPLRYVRKKLTAGNALTLAVVTASVSHELTDLLSFPPARAATGILLLIFKTIQVRGNGCGRAQQPFLAHRQISGHSNESDRMLLSRKTMFGPLDGSSGRHGWKMGNSTGFIIEEYH